MDENYFIKLCISEINKKLKWKDYGLWTETDFKILSEKIQAETKTVISPQTLKRLFGKIKYKEIYNPQMATKDALSKFLGYADWNDFMLSNHEQKSSKTGKPFLFNKKIILIPGILILSVILIFLSKSILYQPQKKSSFVFQDTIGQVPLNVSLLYNFEISKSDSVVIDFDFIHPIFGPEKIKLDPAKTLLNFVYQVPGVYEIKVFHKEKLLKKQKIFALNEAWYSYYIPENTKPYIWLDNIISKDSTASQLYLSYSTIQEHGYPTNKIFDTMHRRIKNFNIDGDNYQLNFQFKNSAETGGITCFDAEVRIFCENNLNYIGLTEKGCQQYSKMKLGEKEFLGEYYDLAKLTFDPNLLNELKIRNSNKHVKIFLNEEEVYQGDYQQANGKIMGIDCVFKGSGVVESILLEDLDGNNRHIENFSKQIKFLFH